MRLGKSIVHLFREIRQHNHLDLFPLRKALRGYTPNKARGDLRAGLNVALLAFPQGMAYAAIAGLPIQYGIFGSAIAAMLGPVLSGSRFIVLGPTNATSVLIFASFLGMGIVNQSDMVALISMVVLLSGIFLVLGAFLQVANLIQYISRSVVTGYITAAAIYIIVNQLKKTLGFDFTLPEGSTFLTVIYLTLKNIPQTHWPTLLISLLTAVTFFSLERRFKTLPNVAISLVLMSGAAYAINNVVLAQGWTDSIRTLNAIDATSWGITLPPIRMDIISQVASVSLVIAFLSVLEGTSIGKSLASRAGQKLDSNQEMLGMGLANIGCALYQGMPASGSLTRSQLNWVSGATTPLASIISGLLCAIGAYTLGPFIHFIPVSVLGVLVIAIGLSLINRHVLRIVWNATGSDRLVFSTTFLAALFIRLDFAIILGTGVSVLLFLRKAAQPELTEFAPDETGQLAPLQKEKTSSIPEISIVHVEGDLFFGASELFRDQMRRVCEKPALKIVLLKMRNAYHMDATSVLALEELIRYMHEQNRTLLVSEVRKDAIRIFKNSGLMDVIGRENIFPDTPSNPTLATAKALKRARQLIGGSEADIRIFLGVSRKKEPGAN
ncbi:MAG TPA: SulP family inorganic anion transporter [Oceanipulchritudo sp.]|nr:SulP family inorganic anion transporter [Oceanipulchritudo sp.]